MFGIYGVAFSLLAVAIAANGFRRGERWAWWALLVGNTIGCGAPMVYDQIVRAVGPFELSEYLGLAVIFGSLAITAPFPRPRRGRKDPAGAEGRVEIASPSRLRSPKIGRRADRNR